MIDLRILLVDEDERCAGRLQACLESAPHLIVPVSNLEEAAEALLIQKFEVIMIGSGQPTEQLSTFVTRLRTLEAQQTAGPQIAVISCTSELAGLSSLDGCLPEDFDAAELSRLLAGVAKASVTSPADGAASDGRVIFDPERFAEQCANEADLMIEIIDLFAEECGREMPEMMQALESGEFDRLSRVAHTIKGSLGSLHASVAWRQAEELETASKAGDLSLCIDALEKLESHLGELNRHLAGFREVCSNR